MQLLYFDYCYFCFNRVYWFYFWLWYCAIRQIIDITQKIKELNVEKMTFADLLATKKIIDDDKLDR